MKRGRCNWHGLLMYGEGMADKAQNGSPKRDEVEDASSSFAWHGVRFGPSLSVVAFRCVAAISYAAPNQHSATCNGLSDRCPDGIVKVTKRESLFRGLPAEPSPGTQMWHGISYGPLPSPNLLAHWSAIRENACNLGMRRTPSGGCDHHGR
jgi:hypothetical protein